MLKSNRYINNIVKTNAEMIENHVSTWSSLEIERRHRWESVSQFGSESIGRDVVILESIGREPDPGTKLETTPGLRLRIFTDHEGPDQKDFICRIIKTVKGVEGYAGLSFKLRPGPKTCLILDDDDKSQMVRFINALTKNVTDKDFSYDIHRTEAIELYQFLNRFTDGVVSEVRFGISNSFIPNDGFERSLEIVCSIGDIVASRIVSPRVLDQWMTIEDIGEPFIPALNAIRPHIYGLKRLGVKGVKKQLIFANDEGALPDLVIEFALTESKKNEYRIWVGLLTGNNRVEAFDYVKNGKDKIEQYLFRMAVWMRSFELEERDEMFAQLAEYSENLIEELGIVREVYRAA